MQLQTVGFTLRPSSPGLKNTFFEIKEIFEQKGIEVLIDDIGAGMIGVIGTSFDRMCKNSDLLVAIGGDGTLISLVRRSYLYNKPVLGITAGNLSFLSDITPQEAGAFLEKMLSNQYRIDDRMMIEGVLRKKNSDSEKFSMMSLLQDLRSRIWQRWRHISIATTSTHTTVTG